MHRITLGDFELTAFSDGTYVLDGGAFFGVIPKIMWSRKMASDDQNRVTSGLNSLLVRTGKQTVLIETGIGNKLSDRMIKFYGQPAELLKNLAAAGITPEDIDIVINSHLHFDHCGWNTIRDKNGKIVPTFPRAKYFAPEGEWQYARNPSERDSISFISDNYDPLVATGQMTLLKGGEEIVPGISVETFRGHTAHMFGIIINGHPGEHGPKACHPEEPSFGDEGPGRAARSPSAKREGNIRASGAHPNNPASDPTAPAIVEERPFEGREIARKESEASAPATACYISDLIPTSAHIDLTWGMGFDLYPLDTVASKKEYYARAIPEKWLTVFTHDPKTPWARIERDELGKMVAKGV